jgi:pyruvate formate lyase activating enzyme
MIGQGAVDKVALDLKTTWEKYDDLLKRECADDVKKSLALLKESHRSGKLPEFEIVHTIFPGMEKDFTEVLKEAEGVDFVLQQGVLGSEEPLAFERLKELADSAGRIIKIRTRDEGEVVCENGKISFAGNVQMTGQMHPGKGETT